MSGEAGSAERSSRHDTAAARLEVPPLVMTELAVPPRRSRRRGRVRADQASSFGHSRRPQLGQRTTLLARLAFWIT